MVGLVGAQLGGMRALALAHPLARPASPRCAAPRPRTPAAFLTMASEIKNRMALVPQAEEGGAGGKGTVSVGPGQAVGGGKSGGGGCC